MRRVPAVLLLGVLAACGAEVVDVTLPKEFRLSWYAHGIIFVTDRATMKAPCVLEMS